MTAAASSADPRDPLWDASFETYYDAYFEEVVADALISRWGRVGDFTKVIVALTASGSAISGWTLWGRPGFKAVWLTVSGLAAILSIVQIALAIPDRIKAHADDKRRFAVLRTGLETFRYRLQTEPFDSTQFNKEFVDLRKTYSDDIGLLNSDTFRTRALEEKAQAQLNAQIADQTS